VGKCDFVSEEEVEFPYIGACNGHQERVREPCEHCALLLTLFDQELWIFL
jgi:hypothetical protein